MKKFHGKREWSESLYYDRVTEEDIAEFEWIGMDPRDGYFTPGWFDWEHFFGFKDRNTFDDTNSFLTYSEIFNIYQHGKI